MIDLRQIKFDRGEIRGKWFAKLTHQYARYVEELPNSDMLVIEILYDRLLDFIDDINQQATAEDLEEITAIIENSNIQPISLANIAKLNRVEVAPPGHRGRVPPWVNQDSAANTRGNIHERRQDPPGRGRR
ncbi:MAG: hypothetical protein ACW963_07100 [Candidatus Sifarchaeia archaeon]|jgi:hypothetical protein